MCTYITCILCYIRKYIFFKFPDETLCHLNFFLSFFPYLFFFVLFSGQIINEETLEDTRNAESDALTNFTLELVESEHNLGSATSKHAPSDDMRYKIDDKPAWFLSIMLGFQVCHFPKVQAACSKSCFRGIKVVICVSTNPRAPVAFSYNYCSVTRMLIFYMYILTLFK